MTDEKGVPLNYKGSLTDEKGVPLDYGTALTKKTIVLDLDSTLLYTWADPETPAKLGLFKPENADLRRRLYQFNLIDFLGRRGEKKLTPISGITRPGLEEFLDFCFKYFETVAVWSAGADQYVDLICDRLFHDLEDPHIIFGFSKCQKNIRGRQRVYEKPIEEMIRQFPERKMSLKRTLIFDDNFTVFAWVNPDNAVEGPEYNPGPPEKFNFADPAKRKKALEELRKDDPTLREIMAWLMTPEVMLSEDVRKLKKKNIFSLRTGTDEENEGEESESDNEEEDSETDGKDESEEEESEEDESIEEKSTARGKSMTRTTITIDVEISA